MQTMAVYNVYSDVLDVTPRTIYFETIPVGSAGIFRCVGIL